MRYYLIAGEASGDLHGANLIRAIKKQQPKAQFRAWGGDRMEKAGAEIVTHYKKMSFMGFIEVLLNIRTILGLLKICKKDILSHKPDVLILIDYPGFNMRIAEFAKKEEISVVYYIAPQVWAWKEKRVEKLKAHTDLLLSILPFEKDFFARHGMDISYVGHPLLDELQAAEEWNFEKKDRYRVALLPGSRKQEIQSVLPIMLEATKKFPQVDFTVAAAPAQSLSFYETICRDFPKVEIKAEQTHQILQQSDAAMVTSGTATLETALIGVPQVVCYKGSFISYRLAKAFIKVPYISLVNLIAGKEMVKELIQYELSAENLQQELNRLLQEETQKKMRKEYAEIREKLGGKGASERAATEIIQQFSV